MTRSRYGLIGTCYNTGISHIASGFAEHLDMKTLLVETKPFTSFPERFKNHRLTKTMSQADIEWLFYNINVLMFIETPYDWSIIKKAKARGIKVVFMPMIEWLDRSRPELRDIDLFLCPSSYTFATMQALNLPGKCVEIPCEVPCDKKKFIERQPIRKVRTFLHNGGHGGIGGRNSTAELLEAISLTDINAKFIIRSQFPLTDKIKDPRIRYIEGNIENYWDLYAEGDIWIMPWKYGVAALGLQESMVAGLLPVITDMAPFNEFMPPKLLIRPDKLSHRKIFNNQTELYADQSPALIAEKLEELYNLTEIELKSLCEWARERANQWDWSVWKPKFQEFFNTL